MTQRSRSSVWRRRSLPRRATVALRASGACAAALVVLYVAAFAIGATERADGRVLLGFLSLRTSRAGEGAQAVTRLFDLWPYALWALIAGAAALWRGGVRLAAAVGGILLAANVSTELLKVLTQAPREPLWLPAASWPSGHVTAAATLALCAVLIAPPRLRPYAAWAAGLAVLGVAYSILVVGSHHPSDVLGGMLMAGAWTGLGVAALELAEQRRPSGRRAESGDARGRALWLAPAVAACAVLGLLGVVAAAAPVVPFLDDHTTFLAGAIGLAAAGAALPAVAATLLDRPLKERAPG